MKEHLVIKLLIVFQYLKAQFLVLFYLLYTHISNRILNLNLDADIFVKLMIMVVIMIYIR